MWPCAMWAFVQRLLYFLHSKCLKHCCAPHGILYSCVIWLILLYACSSSATNVYLHKEFISRRNYWNKITKGRLGLCKHCQKFFQICADNILHCQIHFSVLHVWQFNPPKQNNISASSLPIATAAVCKYSPHQQSWCWRGACRAAWGRVWWMADAPRRAADRWKLWRAGRILSTGLLWIKYCVLSHGVTYASPVQGHNTSLSLRLSV